MNHHAFVIEAEAEAGIEVAQAWARENLGMEVRANPDIIVLRYGLFSVEDARKVAELASGKAFAGTTKAVIIAASRAYHEAQNTLLKLFEEPPKGAHLFLIMPSLGGLLPTLRSRVQVLESKAGHRKPDLPESAVQFMQASKEKRSTLIKKLTSGSDEEKRRENREEAISILNGVEAAAYVLMQKGDTKTHALLSDIAALRGHLYDRSAPVRMILEHLSLVIPRNLIQ